MRMGRYETGKFVEYLRRYPKFVDRVMELLNDFNLKAVKDSFNRLDFQAR
jgi:hypothetical protein